MARVQERSGLADFMNSSLIDDITGSLPQGVDEKVILSRCSILTTNNSFSALVPGWEGIPTAIGINVVMAAKSSEDIYYTDKQINRKHPKAYLPIILHTNDALIGDKVRRDDDNTEDPSTIKLFNTTIGGTSNLKPSKSKGNKATEVIASGIVPTRLKQHGLPHGLSSLESGNLPTLSPSSLPTLNPIEPIEPVVVHRKPTKKAETPVSEEEHELSLLKAVLKGDDTDSVKSLSSKPSTHIHHKKVDDSAKTLKEWIIKYMYIKDKDILQKRGVDALQYVLFQRYLIYFMACMTIICLVIILPLNLYGKRLDRLDEVAYKKTTLLNIKPNSKFIWIHALMTLLIVAMGIYLMESFSTIISSREINIDRKILMIENIPESKRDTQSVDDFLSKQFPNISVRRITFVYDIEEILSLMKKLLTTIEAKRYCLYYERTYGQKCEVRPYILGNILGFMGCCYWFPKVDALEFYTQEKVNLEEDINKELDNAVSRPQRIVFIVFDRKSDAKKTDISATRTKIITLEVVLNLVIIIIFLFLSTPYSVIYLVKSMPAFNQTIEEVPEFTNDQDKVTKMFISYVPTLTLMIMASLLPTFVKLLTQFIPFHTKSEYNHAIMYKSYIYLILMVLILPSISSITLFGTLMSWMDVKRFTWYCMFPTDNGPFFINYVLATATIGNSLELTRLPELVSYILCLVVVSRSPAEYLTARQLTQFEYLIYHVYIPSKINYRMHAKAILFVKISFVFLLLQSKTKRRKTAIDDEDERFPERKHLFNESTSDVVFKVDGQRVPAKKGVLEINSNVFDRMFSGEYTESAAKEIPIKDTTADAFKTMIGFMYLRELILTDDSDLQLIGDVLQCADRYRVIRLVDAIGKHLEPMVTIETMETIADMAHTYRMRALSDALGTRLAALLTVENVVSVATVVYKLDALWLLKHRQNFCKDLYLKGVYYSLTVVN
ncbi:unnamed protein product [Medioppia subpectinata]|uniref:BTB domain-containing protein n=1 Tax=Medioppia subpectinata TaxID=1979941 RepID=A0A7R9KN13_9ACAR|nr:unnamed protein product [Medioppia subpectinata]CAG2106542.1 unnamed protein product [Medioppia subpectinata]